MLFQEVPAFCGKIILKQFLLHGTSICMSSKSISQIFEILFQIVDINLFVLCGVFFSRYVQLKTSFLTKITSAEESETHLSREAMKV